MWGRMSEFLSFSLSFFLSFFYLYVLIPFIVRVRLSGSRRMVG